MSRSQLRSIVRAASACRHWRDLSRMQSVHHHPSSDDLSQSQPPGSMMMKARPTSSSSAGPEPDRVDCVVVGAGVVGVAIARSLALQGREVLMLDMHRQLGFETSSRNSEVIHAGIYYQQGSLKGRLCVAGKHALYDYCRSRGVPHQQTGKLIVATNQREAEKLRDIQQLAAGNGVTDLQLLGRKEVQDMEPALETCCAALLSPSTGIIDSHSLMQAMLADLEAGGGMFVGGSRVLSGQVLPSAPGNPASFRLEIEDTATAERTAIHTETLVNAGGLHAQAVAASIQGLPQASIPPRYLARGCYFTTNQKLPFRHLIYPVPVDGGLGVHLTLDLAGSARFGPDVEWVDGIDYKVCPARAENFYDAIRRYFPALPDGCLEPDYAGIRPKVAGPGEPAGDFVISINSLDDNAIMTISSLISSPGNFIARKPGCESFVESAA